MKYIFLNLGFLLILIPFLIYGHFVLLTDPPVFPDESVFFSLMKSVQQTGHLATSIFGNTHVSELQTRAYEYPPLYFYVLQLWTRIQSETIDSLRWFSMTVASIGLLVFFITSYRITKNSFIATLGTLLLCWTAPFQMAARIARMEILVLTFLIGTVAALVSSRFVLACVLSSLAILTHPLGWLAPITVVVFSLTQQQSWQKKVRNCGLVLFFVAIALLIWVFTMQDRLDLFISQFLVGISYKQARPSLLITLMQRDVSWLILVMLYSVTAIVSIVFARQAKQRFLLFAGVMTGIVLVVVIITVEQWYFVYLHLFPILAGMILLAYALRHKIFALGASALLLLLLIGLVQGKIFVPGMIERRNYPLSYQRFSAAVSEQIPLNSTVFLSSLPDPYFYLRDRIDLLLVAVPNLSNKQSLEAALQQGGVVVVNYFTNQDFANYVQNHAERVVEITEGGYKTTVVYLE